MRKAFQESKWWWYIPIISLFFIQQQSVWALETGTDDRDKYMKTMLVTLLIVYHVLCFFLTLFTYFENVLQ